MRETKLYLAGAVIAWGAGQASADVIGTFWELEAPNVYNLYAAMSSDTIVFNADLGDTTINLPPKGVNTGLFSSMGSIIFSGDPYGSSSPDSWLGIGNVSNPTDLDFARLLTVDPFGTGSMADAAWFVIGGVPAQFHLNDLSDYALQLGHFVVDDGAFIGGMAGGIQSRIFIGWEDMDGVAEFGVFNVALIPTPASIALLMVGGLAHSRRRRPR